MSDVSLALHITEFLVSPRTKIEKRLDRESVRFIYDLIAGSVQLTCSNTTKKRKPTATNSPTAYVPESPRSALTAEQSELKRLLSEFTKKLKHLLPLSNLSTPFGQGESTYQKKTPASLEHTMQPASNSKRQKVEAGASANSKATSSSLGPNQTPLLVPTVPLGSKLSGDKEGTNRLLINAAATINGNTIV